MVNSTIMEVGLDVEEAIAVSAADLDYALLRSHKFKHPRKNCTMKTQTKTQLPIPPHFEPDKVGEVWHVTYQERATQARNWAKKHGIKPAAEDTVRICLLLIDVQNTFCIPKFEFERFATAGMHLVKSTQPISSWPDIPLLK